MTIEHTDHASRCCIEDNSKSHGCMGEGLSHICMGTGSPWIHRTLENCVLSERIEHEEEGTSSGRSELGGYTVILKQTPHNEDLVTTTISEVLCLLVNRWVGHRDKTSQASSRCELRPGVGFGH